MKCILTTACFLTIAFMASFAVPASAGTQVNETTGAILCKGSSSCNSLKAKCSGTYTDATDSAGTPYGKCQPKSAQIGGQVLVAPTVPPHGQRGFGTR